MSRQSMGREMMGRALKMRREVHEKVRRGECEGTGHQPQCEGCRLALWCTELRHTLKYL